MNTRIKHKIFEGKDVKENALNKLNDWYKKTFGIKIITIQYKVIYASHEMFTFKKHTYDVIYEEFEDIKPKGAN
jgi:hypothetical protein